MPPARSTHEPRRKHVSRLRAEIAADAATTRKRIERSATHDRKGRTIAVERLSPSREEARRRAAAETRKPRAAGRGAGKRSRPEHETRERPARSDNREGRRRAEFEPREGAKRREAGPRERGFERPEGRSHDRAGESRPPRAGGKDRGARSEFKPRAPRDKPRAGAPPTRRFDRPPDQHRGAREFERSRAEGRGTDGVGRPPRARSSPGRPHGPPGKGPPKGRSGPRRPPRKP